MSRKPTTPFAGVPRFGGDDEDDDAGLIAPPTPEVRQQAKAAAQAIGFVPRDAATEAAPAAPAAPPTATEQPARVRPTARKRERRVAQYPAHYSLRMTDEDRDRFDAYAEKHRIPKGEAMRRLLDLAEAEERRQEGPTT